MDIGNDHPKLSYQLWILEGSLVQSPTDGYGSIPINTIFSGMNIHLPAILMFTRGTTFWHTARSASLYSHSWNILQAVVSLSAHSSQYKEGQTAVTKISTYPGSAASKQPYVSTLFSDASPMWSLWYLWHLECPLKNNDSSQPFEATGEWNQVLFLFVANPLFDSNSFNSSFSFFAPALFCFGANKWLIYLADSHTCVSIRFPICWQLRSKLETICKTYIKRTFCQHRATVWSTRPKKQSEAAKIKHLSLKDLNGGCILAGGSDSPMRGWRFTGLKHFDTMYSVGPSFFI